MSDENSASSIVGREGFDEPDWPCSPVTGVPRPGAEFVCAVAEALEPDDEVIINNRSRSLTVLGFERQENPGVMSSPDYPYFIVWLRGNGTEYRLRWSHKGDHAPRLHTESELETRESWSMKHQEKRPQTRSTCRGKRVQWIKPTQVEPAEIAEWSLARNLTEVSDE